MFVIRINVNLDNFQISKGHSYLTKIKVIYTYFLYIYEVLTYEYVCNIYIILIYVYHRCAEYYILP